MPKRKTTEQFITEAKEVHGNKYDYSKVEYVNANTKVCIICPDHGEFWQKPAGHYNMGKGCAKCGYEKNAKAQLGTTEEFIAKARKVHGDKYDYSKVEYVGGHSKVTIMCSKHGPFEQTPSMHLTNGGCRLCGVEVRANKLRKTVEQFIAEAKEVHGDKYDYSKVEYSTSGTKVCIICPDHGEFWQPPNSHLSGRGCRKCGAISIGNFRRKSLDSFLAQSKNLYGDKYDYSKVQYIDRSTEVCIVCPDHGEFWQKPSYHLRERSEHGCPLCNIESRSMAARKTVEQFIAEAKEVHGNKYDYSKVEYSTSDAKVCIICPDHGEFWQTPNAHLAGHGCRQCSGNIRLTTEEFIAKARKVHGDKYDYSKVEYISTHIEVCIICPDHGEFWQKPSKHLSRGDGCPSCSLISEPIFRKVLQEITSLKFPKKKPEWLRNPNTNSLLELDCYNQKTKIAFELQGIHHYGPVEHWGGEEGFQKTLERDQIKKIICEEKGIHLFCVDQRPATGKTPQEKEEYYKKEIKKCLQQLPQHVKIKMNRR